MILCFNCSKETKKLLDQLAQSGHYSDYAEIIAVAVANLSVLETEMGEQGSLIIGNTTDQQEYSSSYANYKAKQHVVAELGMHDHDRKNRPIIPTMFLLNGIAKPSNVHAKLPNDVWMKGQEIPIDRWIFGQYNRLLPAKAGCRALGKLLTENRNGVLIEEAALQIAQEASVLGDFLKLHDESNAIGRDDLLSTAFPTTDNEKSRQRFENQFIGSVNREGQISGLLIDLKLINRVGTKSRIHLTKPGWYFATMPNPIFDSFQQDPLQKFTAEEKAFLVEHVSNNLPVEDFAYKAIMSAIECGANTPDTMDEFLQERIPTSMNRDFSASFLSTQRSGAVSRMTDLGLVRRVRDGVRVLYEITESGQVDSLPVKCC
jgi:hypothetical protein